MTIRSRHAPQNRPTAGLPTRKQILDFIAQSGQPAGKREIARAFGLHGHDKIMLKALLKDMADEGLIDSAPGRAFHKAGGVPKVTVLRVISIEDGQVLGHARELARRHARAAAAGDRARAALGAGAQRPHPRADRGSRARAMSRMSMKKLERVGRPACSAWSGRRASASSCRRSTSASGASSPITDLKDAQPGDLVLAEPAGRPPRVTARVDAVLGDPFAPRSFWLIAIHKHGLRDEFRDEAIDEAKKVAKHRRSATREDLTHLPIVAIDPEDARDHDDAIWAQPARRRRLGRDRRHRRRQLLRPPRLASSTARRGRAATASISPTASCRCCPTNCRRTSAR